MDAFTLAAKLTLDSSDFETRLAGAEDQAKSQVGSTAVFLGNLASQAATRGVSAMVDFAKSAVETGEEFDAMMSKVGEISGATGDEMTQLTDLAKRMGATTAFTATEAAEGLMYMGMAGWNADQMIAGLPGILSLAAASGTDLGRASDIVTDALTAFGLGAEDAAHFSDILAVASANANTNVEMMGETFKYVAAAAGSLHISAEDTAEAIGLIANAGIKGSQAGTALRSIITRIATDAGASEKTLGALGIITEELGVQAYDAEGKFRDFGDILTETRAAWQGLSDDQQKTNFAKQIAGQYGLSAWLALMDASTESVDQLRAAIEDSDGAAENMAAGMLDNLKGDITLLNSALDGLKLVVSDKFTANLRDGTQTITGWVTTLADVIENGIGDTVERAQRKEAEAVADATENMTKSQGLIDYMDGLVAKFGEAATSTDEWKTALEALKTLLPEVNTAIQTTGGSAQATIDTLNNLNEATYQQALEKAKQATIGTYQEAYNNARDALNQARVNVDVYGAQRQTAADRMISILQQAGGAGYGLSNEMTDRANIETGGVTKQLERRLKSAGEKIGMSGGAVDGLISAYNDAAAAEKTNAASIENLTAEMEKTQSALQLAEESFAKLTTDGMQSGFDAAAAASADLAARMASVSMPTFTSGSLGGDEAPHAKGAWEIPTDQYKAVLHRGEIVLNASRAREYREGRDSGGGGSQLTPEAVATIARSAVESLAMEFNGEVVGRIFGDATTRRVQGNMTQINRRQQYGYGG